MAKSGKWPLQGGFILLFALFFVQQTPLILVKDWPGRVGNENAWRLELEKTGLPEKLFTYDQHYALLTGIPYRLPVVVPSNKANCTPLVLREGEWLLAGPYAFSEYRNCIPWEELEKVVEIEDENYPATWYRRKAVN